MDELDGLIFKANESVDSCIQVVKQLHEENKALEALLDKRRQEARVLEQARKEDEKRTILELERIQWLVETYQLSSACTIKGKVFCMVLLQAVQTALNTIGEYIPF